MAFVYLFICAFFFALTGAVVVYLDRMKAAEK